MRLFSLITAICVALVLYGIVLKRDELTAFAANVAPAQATEDTEVASDTPQPEQVAEAEIAEDTSDDMSNAVRVMALKSTAQLVDTQITLRGETEAMRQVNVSAETAGRVISEPLRKGAFVQEGELLCQLDPGTRAISLAEAEAALADAKARVPEVEARVPEAEARLAEAMAALTEAKINETAASRLSEGGFASETRVAAATAQLRSSEAAVTSAKAGVAAAKSGIESAQAGIQRAETGVARAKNDITKLNIAAPFAGLLETDTAELGALLQSGSHCATILQLDPIKLVGFVPETQVGGISVGARAGARFTDGSNILGRVSFVSRSADPLTRTFRVEINVPNGGLQISAGQTVEIGIQSEGAPAHLIPQSSLTLNDDGDIGVRTVTSDMTAKFMPVTIIRDTIEGMLVADLPETVSIIIVGQEFVTDGVKVAPAYEEVIQ